MKNAVWQKLWKILENTEILNLSQQKEEETIWFRIKLSYHKVFHKNFVSNRNKKKQQRYCKFDVSLKF